MNRIYQGRVSVVQVPKAGTKGEWETLPGWQAALWNHHELFQDAVNYYFAAFAAMVSPDDQTVLGKYRRLVSADLWPIYSGRKGSWKQPFGKACSALNLVESADFETFSSTLFRDAAPAGADVPNRQRAIAEVFALAIASATDTADVADDSLTQRLAGKGRDYFPKLKQLCAPHGQNGTTPTNKVAQQGLAAKAVAQRVAQNPVATISIEEAYLFKAAPGRGKTIVGAAAKSELLARSKSAYAKSAHADAAQNDLAALLATLTDGFTLSQPGGKTPADYNAALLFAHQPQSVAWRAIFLDAVKGRLKREIKEASSDPVQDLRGDEDLPLFPFFTNLIADRNGLYVAWEDFEKQAFVEVFTKVGRFLIEQRRRDGEMPALRQRIDTFSARVASEARLRSLKRLLQRLGGERVDDDGNPLPYGIRARSLKSWPELRKQWRELALKSPPSSQDYLDAKRRLQKRRQTKFGNSTLFHALTEPANHVLWNYDESGTDIFTDWARYTDDLDDLKHLSEAPSFTPAHAEHSPRFFRWSENQNKTHLSWSGEGPFAVRVHAFDFSGYPLRRSQWLLYYRAPRLLRDGLRGKDDVRTETIMERGKKKKRVIPLCDWLPPVLKARPDLFAGAKQSIDGTSVRLMPTARDNFQLVLEADLDNSVWVHTRGQTSDLFYRNKRNEVLERLKWPSPTSDQHPAWFTKGRTTCLSVDLGLRTPASFALVECTDAQRFGKPERFHRNIGGPAFPTWSGTVLLKGVIRLSGENRLVYRHPTAREVELDSKLDSAQLYLLEELSGARGRRPSNSETEEAAAQFLKLDFSLDRGKREARIDHERPDWKVSASFPEQNDLLLRAFARLRSQLFTLNRWDEQLSVAADTRQVREELAQRRADDNLRDLLSNSDPTELLTKVRSLSNEFIALLRDALPILADRILPTRGKSWRWFADRSRWHQMVLVEDFTRNRIRGAGQRGISIARIWQIQHLRRAAQSLNHLCRHEPGKRYRAPKRDTIPDPFVEAGLELEKLKAQRAKQLAHEIFARAIGVELAKPPQDKLQRRRTESLHGVYRTINGRQPVDFIVLERLAPYRTSQLRSRRENRQLADWGHRGVVRVLEELCELIALPILYVDPAYSSQFSAYDGCPGFRAEEIPSGLSDFSWLRRKSTDDEDYARLVADLERAPEARRLLKPGNGGPLFVPLAGDEGLISHADVNAAINLAFRAIAHRDDDRHWPKRWAGKATRMKKLDEAGPNEMNAVYLLDHMSVLGGVDVASLQVKAVEITGAKEADLWDCVNGELAWRRCHEINDARLARWRREADVPGHPEL